MPTSQITMTVPLFQPLHLDLLVLLPTFPIGSACILYGTATATVTVPSFHITVVFLGGVIGAGILNATTHIYINACACAETANSKPTRHPCIDVAHYPCAAEAEADICQKRG